MGKEEQQIQRQLVHVLGLSTGFLGPCTKYTILPNTTCRSQMSRRWPIGSASIDVHRPPASTVSSYRRRAKWFGIVSIVRPWRPERAV